MYGLVASGSTKLISRMTSNSAEMKGVVIFAF
jgi:hypothetical protein